MACGPSTWPTPPSTPCRCPSAPSWARNDPLHPFRGETIPERVATRPDAGAGTRGLSPARWSLGSRRKRRSTPMLRRRRPPPKEIVFGFDSFLDLVANVVGIIIRLILVVWVGARAYTGLAAPKRERPPEPVVVEAPVLSTEAEESALAEARTRLDDTETALLSHLRRQNELSGQREQEGRHLAEVIARRVDLEKQAAALESQRGQAEGEKKRLELSTAQLHARADKLKADALALTADKRPARVLRYQTPVAQVVQSEELQFECRAGRIAVIDVDALLREVRQGVEARGQQLPNQGEVTGETESVGAFLLRYTVARERGLLEAAVGADTPDAHANFRYGLDGWEAVPVREKRGETVAAALRPESEFRRIIDALDPKQTAVTVWVYPDSFAAYRKLRDYCLGHDLLVAGRPLPDGYPIASSRRGTASRGQ